MKCGWIWLGVLLLKNDCLLLDVFLGSLEELGLFSVKAFGPWILCSF
jgi:hypothetical protein